MAASTATQTIARPVGNGFLIALLKRAVDFLARREERRMAAEAVAPVPEAPASNDVDLWKLYWSATGSGSINPKVRQTLRRAAGE